jgi:hypothetical protein
MLAAAPPPSAPSPIRLPPLAMAGGTRGAERVLPAPLLRAGRGGGGEAQGRGLDAYRAMPTPLVGRMPVAFAQRR